MPADVSLICPICSAAPNTVDASSQTDFPETSTPDRLKPGQSLAGFEILEELNHGGMGVIYKARQTGLNRLVALKVILPDRVGPETIRRFQREVRAAALLSHPNIVTVYHTDLEGAQPYLAMEYVAGIDLSRLVKRKGPRTPQDACFYIKEAAEGLQHAFEQGLVHRDIKPANLMVTPSPLDPTPSTRKPTVKILDMGLARVTSAHDIGDAGGLTQAGEFLGTPDYISPEQAEDPRSADIRSDLYSLGGTFYFLLTGEVPLFGSTLVQKVRRLLTGPIPSILDRKPDLPGELDTIVRKLMARDPKNRFQTPQDLISALEDFEGHVGAAALRTKRRSAPSISVPESAAEASAPVVAKAVEVVRAHTGGVRALSLSADGKLLLSGGQDETLRLWDTVRMTEARCVAGDVGPVEDVALSPNGKWAVSCALRLFRSDMVAQVWDLASGSQRRRLKGHSDNIYCVAISPDGRKVAAGSGDKTISIWALDQAGSPVIKLTGHVEQVTSLTFLPGGDALLSGSHDGSVRLWDAKTGNTKGNISGQVGKVSAVAFGGPKKRMAIAGDYLRIRHRNGSFVNLTGHRGNVLSVAFSPDAEHVLSGGADGTVRIWLAETGRQVEAFEGHTGPVHAVAFSPDSPVVYSGSADGTIRRWELPE